MTTPHYHGTLPWNSPPEPVTTGRTKRCRYCGWPIFKRRTVCGPCGPRYKKHRTKALQQRARLIELAKERKNTR